MRSEKLTWNQLIKELKEIHKLKRINRILILVDKGDGEDLELEDGDLEDE